MEKTVDPHPVGFRFRPTDEEIVDHYLRSKNMDGNTSHVDEVISTVDICSFDPWELASHSITTRKETDYVWYFYGRKDNRGERQSRKTKSGFWKKTGNTMDIFRKRGNHEQIGEKRVLVFHYSGKILGGPKPKSEWVMHEYVATFLSPTPTAMVTYTVCKVMFKGDTSDLPSTSASAGGCEVEHSRTLITPMNNLGGGLSSEAEESSSELQDPRQFSGFLHLEEETQIEDAIRRAINNLSPHDLNSLLNNDYDDDEQGKTQE